MDAASFICSQLSTKATGINAFHVISNAAESPGTKTTCMQYHIALTQCWQGDMICRLYIIYQINLRRGQSDLMIIVKHNKAVYFLAVPFTPDSDISDLSMSHAGRPHCGMSSSVFRIKQTFTFCLKIWLNIWNLFKSTVQRILLLFCRLVVWGKHCGYILIEIMSNNFILIMTLGRSPSLLANNFQNPLEQPFTNIYFSYFLSFFFFLF